MKILKILFLLCLCAASLQGQMAPMFRANASGDGWSADSLSNIEIGKFFGRTVDYRYVSDHTGNLIGAEVFFIFRGNPSQQGYWNGNGGTILVQSQGDDPNQPGQPGQILGSYTIFDPLTSNCGTGCVGASYRTLSFTPIPQVYGNTYHLTFQNIASDPVNNWISLDGLYTKTTGTNLWPMVWDSTFAMQFSNAPPLVVAEQWSPVVNLIFDDSYVQGNAYIDVIATEIQASGVNYPSALIEMFTTDASAHTINQVNLRLSPQSAASATVQLFDANQVLLAIGTISFPGSTIGVFSWYPIQLDNTITLLPRTQYSISLTAISGAIGTRLLEQGTKFGFKQEDFTGFCTWVKNNKTVPCYGGGPSDVEYYLSLFPTIR